MQKTINFCEMSPEMTRRLNEIAESYRNVFTEFVDKMSLKYHNSLFWWFTPLASRNTAVSNCFYEVCLLKLIIEEVAREKPERILVPAVSIQKAITSNLASDKQIQVVVQDERKNVKNILKNNSRIHYAYALSLLKKRVKTVQKATNINSMMNAGKQDITLVCSYRIASQFKNEGYQDRYFQGLQENTDENIVYFVHLVFHTIEEGRILAENAASASDTIIFEKFVENQDFRKVKEYSNWCLGFNASGCRMDGMDITALVNHAVHLGGSNLNAMYGVLKAIVLLRLLETYKLRIKKVIDWYEGQPSSNGMICMLRKEYPDIPTIAYVMSPCPENNLALYPSKLQVRENCVPEYFAVQGSGWKKTVRQFEHCVKCIPAPSFRYQDVFGITYGESYGNEAREGVLLVLSYSREASAYLLKQFFQAAEGFEDLKVFIKNHPSNAGFGWKDYGVDEPEHKCKVCFVSGRMEDALKNREMVIMTETSSGLEVVLRGLFAVIFAAPGRLRNICFPDDVMKPCVAYNAKDLQRCLKMRKQFQPDADQLTRLRERAFLKVNKENVSKLLEMREF